MLQSRRTLWCFWAGKKGFIAGAIIKTKYGLDVNLLYTVNECTQKCAYKYVFFSAAMGINRSVYLEKCAYYYSAMRFISGCFTRLQTAFFDVGGRWKRVIVSCLCPRKHKRECFTATAAHSFENNGQVCRLKVAKVKGKVPNEGTLQYNKYSKTVSTTLHWNIEPFYDF